MEGMGKASRMKQAPDRRARIAAQRAAEKRRQQRKRIYMAGGSILAVVIVVVAFVLVKANSSDKAASSSNGPTGAALTALTNKVTSVSPSVLDKVGGGDISSSLFIPGSKIPSATVSQGSYFATTNGTPLTQNGKPEVLYVGAEYCPFCAAERWPMVIALSRFGTFSGLRTIHSSSSDAYPNTPTWTFYGSTYTSKYVSFTPVEETTNEREGNSSNPDVPYVTLQTPTAAEQALVTKYDPTENVSGQTYGGAIPFVDIGNKYVQVGDMSPYGPQDLQGKSWDQVAAALADPSSTIGKGADASANYLTAGICSLTHNQPASACTPVIRALEKKFAS
jgi:thiol-disulfide isomerase/thioredoxin